MTSEELGGIFASAGKAAAIAVEASGDHDVDILIVVASVDGVCMVVGGGPYAAVNEQAVVLLLLEAMKTVANPEERLGVQT